MNPKPINWSSSVSKNCLADALHTYRALTKTDPNLNTDFTQALFRYSTPKKIVWFEPSEFDKKVKNHFPLSNLEATLKFVPRPNSVQFHLNSDNVSPVVLAKIKGSYILLDGNHRCIAAALRHSKIAALVIEDFSKTTAANLSCTSKGKVEASFSAPNTKLSSHIDHLELRVIPYTDLAAGNQKSVQTIRQALSEDGMVGIKGIPGYRECAKRFIDDAREFAALDFCVKQKYIPNGSDRWLGYRIGDKFRKEDGTEIIDNTKSSFYACVSHGNSDPHLLENIWPGSDECKLKTSYLELGRMMYNMINEVLAKSDLVKKGSSLLISDVIGIGRMVHYKSDPKNLNLLWCESHFDDGLFTALLPAYYFKDGANVAEPEEAGLFIQRPKDGKSYKVDADPEILLFLTGKVAEFASNGFVSPTKHCVRRPKDSSIERFTLGIFTFCKFMNWYISSIKTSSDSNNFVIRPIQGKPLTILKRDALNV